jgi:hypothetical protein
VCVEKTSDHKGGIDRVFVIGVSFNTQAAGYAGRQSLV